MRNASICALCRKVGPLRRSHIIPKFTHKRIKKDDGRLRHFDKRSHPDGGPVQDAFYEHLLCPACEDLFQKWEDHAARMFNQKEVFDFRPTTGRQPTRMMGFDYAKMKLFLLSILWRMGAASDRIFSSVELGPHLDRIGRMLLASDPGAPAVYGCTAIVVHVENERIQLTRPADSIRYETQNLRMYRALVDGVLLAWIVGSVEHMSNFKIPQLFLHPDGGWCSYSKDWQDLSFLKLELTKLANGTLNE